MHENIENKWDVTRTIVFFPPYKAHKVPHIEFHVPLLLRPQYGNKGRGKFQGSGGQYDLTRNPADAAIDSLLEELGISAQASELHPLGVSKHYTKDSLTISTVFLLLLSQTPEQLSFPLKNDGVLLFPVFKGENDIQRIGRDEYNRGVLTTTLAFDTYRYVQKAIPIARKLRVTV